MTILSIIAAALTIAVLVFILGYHKGIKDLEKEIDEGLKNLKEDKGNGTDTNK